MIYRIEKRLDGAGYRVTLEDHIGGLFIAEHTDARLALIDARKELWDLIGQMDYELARGDD